MAYFLFRKLEVHEMSFLPISCCLPCSLPVLLPMVVKRLLRALRH